MKITHISNAFLIVDAGPVIVCDPWVGHACHGAWHSFPEYDRAELIALVQRADAVYISHLHSDHFDPAFLSESGLVAKPFIIKNFKNGTLRRRLAELGATQIIELEPWAASEFMGAKLTIIPQMTSTSSGLRDDVNYDMDTSLVVHAGGETFFNQVDNPLSEEDMKVLATWIFCNYGKLDYAALSFGAASEYPQCFLNVDRDAEKHRIIAESMQQMNVTLSILKPRIFFPAGNSYFIAGRNHHLNKWLAIPTFYDILCSKPERRTSGIEAINLAGGYTINGTRLIKPTCDVLEKSIEAHKGDEWDSELHPMELDIGMVNSAMANWLHRAPKGSSITIHVLDEQDRPIHALICPGDDHHLQIMIDESDFMRCVFGTQSWNQTLSGSLCTFTREPNVHRPNDLFGLNYLVAKNGI